MRHTRHQTGIRRSHHALKAQNLTLCSNCGVPVTNHTACPNCGYYKGRKVVDMMKKADKKSVKVSEVKKEKVVKVKKEKVVKEKVVKGAKLKAFKPSV